ncbi:MAG: hypothetical protein KIS83_10150 [Rubrivivax sp.]|nr:hypothetical protein [Rubrivivax sp.]
MLSTSNGLLANTFRSVIAPYYDPFYGSKIANSYGGGVKNPYWGAWGCNVIFSGGHSNTNDNSVIIAEYQADRVEFKRVTDPAPVYGTGTDSTTRLSNANGSIQAYLDWIGDPATDGQLQYGEFANLPTPYTQFNGQPGASHTYGILVAIGPEHGGAAQGTILKTTNPAVGRENWKGAIAAHALDLTTTDTSSPFWWRRATQRRRDEGFTHWRAPLLCTYVPTHHRVYITARGGTGGKVAWFDIALGDWVEGSGAPFDFHLADSSGAPGYDAESGCQFYVPERGLLLCCYSSGDEVRIQWMDVSVAQPTLGGTVALSQALSTVKLDGDTQAWRKSWGAATWCPDNSRIIVAGVEQDAEAAYEIEIPTRLTDTWIVTRAPYGAGQTFYPNGHTTYQKFQYDHKLRAITWFPFASTDGPDTMHVYRPRST